MIWIPDICVGNPCQLEIAGDWSTVGVFFRYCDHHSFVKSSLLLTDQDLFTVMKASNRTRELAKTAAKEELNLAEEISIDVRTTSAGDFVIGEDENGVQMSNWPNSGVQKTSLTTAINNAIAQLVNPAGTSVILIS